MDFGSVLIIIFFYWIIFEFCFHITPMEQINKLNDEIVRDRYKRCIKSYSNRNKSKEDLNKIIQEANISLN